MFQSLCYSKLNFLIQYQFPISFFTCGYKVFLTPFVEETLFPALYSWHACGGSVDHICCVFTSRLLFCSIPLCLCLWQYHARTHKHVFAGISRNWNTPTLLVGVQDSAATMENCIEVLTDIENRRSATQGFCFPPTGPYDQALPEKRGDLRGPPAAEWWVGSKQATGPPEGPHDPATGRLARASFSYKQPNNSSFPAQPLNFKLKY